MTSEQIKLIVIIVIVIVLIVTRAWIFILDTIINLIKRIFKLENVSEHKWHIKKNNEKKWLFKII